MSQSVPSAHTAAACVAAAPGREKLPLFLMDPLLQAAVDPGPLGSGAPVSPAACVHVTGNIQEVA